MQFAFIYSEPRWETPHAYQRGELWLTPKSMAVLEGMARHVGIVVDNLGDPEVDTFDPWLEDHGDQERFESWYEDRTSGDFFPF